MTSLGVVRSLATGDLDRLARARAGLVDGLRARLEEHRQALLAELSAGTSGSTTSEPTVVGDIDLYEGRREMVEALLEIGLRAIERGEPRVGPLPEAVGAQARRAAAAGMSVTSVLERCMTGFSLMRDLFFVELERRDLPRDDERLLRHQASHVLDSLRRGMLRELEEAHEQTRVRDTRSHEQLRAEIAERILAGATPTPEELADFGHALDAWHLAVIATGADAKQVVRYLEAQLRCQILPISRGEQAMCALLGAQHRIAFEDIERVLAGAKRTEVTVAVGESARQLGGLRLTHEEAEVTLEVAHRRGCKLMRYRDVALEAAVLQNKALGDALIERCLTPLDAGRGDGRRLRRVIRAVFDAEYNKSSAAKALRVDPETVRRYVTEIEQRLGCPLHALQTEIDVALRVEELRRSQDVDGAQPPRSA